jgi:hypothetical protein
VPAAGADRIAEALFALYPDDARILAAASAFGPYLLPERALEWSARLRAIGADEACPLVAMVGDADVQPLIRVRAACLAHGTFGDERVRPLLEAAAADIPEADLAEALRDVLEVDPDLADSFVVGAATTARRGLATATALWSRGALDEAYAVLAHALALEDADDLDANGIRELVPEPASAAIERVAEARSDAAVVDVLRRVEQEYTGQ